MVLRKPCLRSSQHHKQLNRRLSEGGLLAERVETKLHRGCGVLHQEMDSSMKLSLTPTMCLHRRRATN